MSRKYQQISTFSKIMKKRRLTGEVYEVSQPKLRANQQKMEEEKPYRPEQQLPDLEFEDQFEDQFEEEEAWISESQQSNGEQGNTIQSSHQQNIQNNNIKQKAQVFIGTKKNLKKGEILDFDNNAYDMLHRLNTEWPSLSIDFICKDSPFNNQALPFLQMKKYPFEVYTVQGSSNNTQNNSVYLTKWVKLHKTKYDDDPDAQGDEEDDDIANDQQPEVIVQQIQTTYSVNRIKSLANSPIVAFWNDQGEIHIMDLTKNFQKLQNNVGTKKKQTAREIILESEIEGFGLSWNPHRIGQLVTGNCSGQVQIFENNQNYTSWSKSAHYAYHKGSIQDIVFSPNQPSVFATCSSDGTLQVVDLRVGDFKKSQLLIKAHQKDVNVCDWNKISPNLIATGSDDCSAKVWDLRKIKEKNRSQELICFNWHNQPITSIRFQPNQQSVVAVASEDNSISIWDMACQNQEEDPQIPNELMFIHQGQQQIKEIVFHPVYYEMILSTAGDGINIFKPSYQMPEQEQEGDPKEDLKRPPIKEEQLDQYLEKMRKRGS